MKMADMLIEQGMIDHLEGDRYGGGYLDDYDYSNGRSKKEVKCKKCGETNLYWGKTKHGKWWFKDKSTGSWHNCT